MRSFSVLLVLALALVSCKKEPGEGGKAEIRGFVSEQAYNVNGNPSGDPYPAVDVRVYIIYGDGQFHDDDTRTGPNGEYRFPWLRKGDYRLYAISECDNDNCREAVYQSVQISGRKDVVTAPSLVVNNY
jgi:hypothetical protein